MWWFAIFLVSCAPVDPSPVDTSAPVDKNPCDGLKSAHCWCDVVAGAVVTSGSPDDVNDPGVRGKELFTWRIPDKCYVQEADVFDSAQNGGCKRDCRAAFGLDGGTEDPGVTASKAAAADELFRLNVCGDGTMRSPITYAAGTNDPLPADDAGIDIALVGTVEVVDGEKTCR